MKSKAEAGSFISFDECPRHGFAALCIMALDENGSGGGTRVLGPKSCCGHRQERKRWRITNEQIDEIIEALNEVRRPTPQAVGAQS